jgi:hypothetical protein
VILQIDDDDHRLQVFVCDSCDGIHFAEYDKDGAFVKQVTVRRDYLNALITELMKLRDASKVN